MKPTNSPDAPDFEEQARRLLARYAESMPIEASVEARVRSQLAAQEPQRHTARRWRMRRQWGVDDWVRGAVSLALVIVLIAGFAAVLRGYGGASTVNKLGGHTGTCATVTTDHAVALCPGGHVQAQVIVGQSYVDPTRTAIQLRLSLTGAELQFGSAAPLHADRAEFRGMTLQDSQGNVYAANLLTEPINLAHKPNVVVDDYGAAEFDPLPQSELRAPQSLTLHIQQIALYYPFGGIEKTLLLNGPWTVTAQVTPQAGRSIAFDIAPETFDGITVQPLRLDIGPSGSAFDSLNGGACVTVRISGLAPDMRRSAVANFSWSYIKYGVGGASSNGPASLLFGGKEPANIAGIAGGYLRNASSSLDPVVGPTGSIDLEFIFLAPHLPKLTGTQTLTLNQIPVATNPTRKFAKGNWSFQLPLG